jgi:hypothetical protein
VACRVLAGEVQPSGGSGQHLVVAGRGVDGER